MPHHPFRRPGSRNWWIDVKVKGRKRIRRSAGTTDKAKAQALAVRIEAQEWERLTNGDRSSLTFAEAVTLYLADGHSDQFLAPLVKHFKNTKVMAIRPGHIRSAARVLYPQAKPSTWNRQVIVPARAVINSAADKDLAAYIKVKSFPELRTAKPLPADDWLPRFMTAAESALAAMALFMRITGSRIGQAIALDWKAMDLASAQAIIPAAKKHPERIAELTPQLVALLANLPGERRGLVFGFEKRWMVYRHWKAACKRAGIPYVPTHPAGRKSFATTMARRGVDPKTAAVRGGWKSVRLMLEIYTEANVKPGLISDVFGTFESQPAPKNSKTG